MRFGYMDIGISQKPFKLRAMRPLGDAAIVVSFDTNLSVEANASVISFSKKVAKIRLKGVLEVVPSLVSVLIRYNPSLVSFAQLAADIRMMLNILAHSHANTPNLHEIAINFGGDEGPDLSECAAALNMTEDEFIRTHNQNALSVLSVGFAPGFIYCGLHASSFSVPRRTKVRPMVSAGSVLFAAGQTAIAATDIPTGWNVIGRTQLRNFQPDQSPPIKIIAGDKVNFTEQKS